MVNSKKMSKSSVAVVVLAIILALGMILGITGAWFTSEKDAGDVNNSFGFGTVKITSATAEITRDAHAHGKVVDGCSWNVSAEYVNDSDVPIYYAVTYSVELFDKEGALVEDEDVLGYFTGLVEAEPTVKYAAAGAEDQLAGAEIKFNSNGAMNGYSDEYTIKVTLSVKAIQADHTTVGDLNTYFDTSLEELPAQA